MPFEATDYAALPHIVRDAQAWLGGIDLLINNAGVSQRSLALDTDFSVYRHLMEVDFFAPLHLTQLVLPRMVERRSGQIAIISSVAGKAGVPLRTGYCAAKHACVGYFDALRSEVEAAYGIHVSVILPGSVKTAVAINAVRGDGSTFGRTDANIEGGMPADRAAGRILDGLAANSARLSSPKAGNWASWICASRTQRRCLRCWPKKGPDWRRCAPRRGRNSRLSPPSSTRLPEFRFGFGLPPSLGTARKC